MVILVSKKADELKLKKHDLLTRPVGRLMYESIGKQLRPMGDDETLVLDFSGIKVIDSSFIDEMIVRLVQDSKNESRPFYIKLRNVSEISEINIDLVFRSYSNYKNKKIVVITENICQNNAFYIGPLSDEESHVVEFLRVNKRAKIDDVVRFSGLPKESMSVIMEDLHAMRVVKKEDRDVFVAL